MTQTALPAVAFVGKQNSGKTTLLEKVVAELTERAVRVATIKHHSHAGFEFDIEGKDSWRHRRAGSVHTIVAAPDQMASVRSLDPACEPKVVELIEMMALESRILGDAPHLVLVEGYRHGELPTIELFRAANPKDCNRDLGAEDNEVIAVVTDIPRVAAQAQAQALPIFSFDDPCPLADFLMALIRKS
ncbi:MAG: molybdopterin-guanine dinucleotide biosynthesis protein B [Coriobacteriales bacterium]|jgi:molybdopterin-guanine dinucleotide biosynthesis protein MobB|nr:molybdopterin-guanine dinucleotide biosynthesis protein B [Coriobacteriales bacterium]